VVLPLDSFPVDFPRKLNFPTALHSPRPRDPQGWCLNTLEGSLVNPWQCFPLPAIRRAYRRSFGSLTTSVLSVFHSPLPFLSLETARPPCLASPFFYRLRVEFERERETLLGSHFPLFRLFSGKFSPRDFTPSLVVGQ